MSYDYMAQDVLHALPHYPYQSTPNAWATRIPGTSQFRWECTRCGIGGGGFDTADDALDDAEQHRVDAYQRELDR